MGLLLLAIGGLWIVYHYEAKHYEAKAATSIPADRITELEAEVAKLKNELEKLNAHD